MFFVYNLILIIFAVILFPVIAVAFIIQPKLRAGFFKKLGFYNYKTGLNRKSIWVHAVSVGEINATEGLIKRIKKEFPDYVLVVTTVTRTGQEVANKKLGNIADLISYFPYDFDFSTQAAIKTFDPALVIIAETEIWPGFINQLCRKNVPIMLVNGRISPGSFKGYKKARFFFKNVLKKFSLILMQTESDKDRIVKIGAPPEITEVMGNLKFDISRNLDENAVKNIKESLKITNSRILTAGSTHSGEDEIVLNVYNKLKSEFQDLKLLLAPRHPERNEKVMSLIKSGNYKYGLRSNQDTFENTDIILLDTMGELGQLYSVSHIAFIGGGFSGTGGHNPLEAAIYGVPVASGPTVFNFKDIYSFMTQSGAAKIVNDENDLYLQFKNFLIHADNYNKSSKACYEIFEKNRGALEYAIEKIKKYI
ncbi:MAG TPA: 3-deoxy-D-manno-octulosonic acid transferase [Candidatus Gastranaerophilales bacterium]|nr:3-deoxy-D-manno-octulosonic acid transferase [Candidatus Gastranaerophilales bacterium]